MAGLLGSMLAGAAGGYAKARISSIDKQEDFDQLEKFMVNEKKNAEKT